MKIKAFHLCLPLLLTASTHAETSITPFFTSHSFSNVIPVKQLIKDDWKQAPDSDASNAFTQNEAGIRAYINNFSLSISHRYDYFVDTNSDTAEVFYLNRQDKALDTQDRYDIDLKLLHQRSNGVRLGYKLDFQSFSTEFRLGYWQLNATRESNLNGVVSSDLNGNIAADAQLSEYYSTSNFLRRQNNDDWETRGSGVTLDAHFQWQPTTDINIAIDLKDIYSDFQLKDSGFSDGVVDTDGTFINSIGGVAYLPLYRGREITAKHQFELPKTIHINAVYNQNDLGYLVNITRQGNINFYYVGVEFYSKNTTTRLMLDIENTAPEIQFSSDWLTAYFSIDDTDINKAMLLKLGLNLHFAF